MEFYLSVFFVHVEVLVLTLKKCIAGSENDLKIEYY